MTKKLLRSTIRAGMALMAAGNLAVWVWDGNEVNLLAGVVLIIAMCMTEYRWHKEGY